MLTAYALLFTLAAIGVSETVYLLRKRKVQEKPICVLGDACHRVLESKYNKIFFVQNDILGLVFYLVVAFITAFLVLELQPHNLWSALAKLLIFGAALMSLYFTYLQWRVIKAWCFWCLMSAATIFLMALIILLIQS